MASSGPAANGCPICQGLTAPVAGATGRQFCGHCAATFVAQGAERLSLLGNPDDPTTGAPRVFSIDPEFHTHYRLGRVLGQGSFGLVVRATQLSTQREVAVKFLVPSPDAQVEARFIREGRALASIHHSNILKIFDLSNASDHLWMVTELLEGGTLADRLGPAGPLPPQEAMRQAIAALSGLDACHSAGILHRDLKPANLLFAANGELKIADFGLSRLAEDTAHLTRPGAVMGTPLYMSPEQARGDEASPASDLYALGVILHEMLAGTPPFAAPGVAELLAKHLAQPPPRLEDLAKDVPGDLAAYVRRLLAKAPTDRPPSASTAAKELAGLARRGAARPVGRPRSRPVSVPGESRERSSPPAAHSGWHRGGAVAVGGIAVTFLIAMNASSPRALSPPSDATAPAPVVDTTTPPASIALRGAFLRAADRLTDQAIEDVRREMLKLPARLGAGVLPPSVRPGPGMIKALGQHPDLMKRMREALGVTARAWFVRTTGLEMDACVSALPIWLADASDQLVRFRIYDAAMALSDLDGVNSLITGESLVDFQAAVTPLVHVKIERGGPGGTNLFDELEPPSLRRFVNLHGFWLLSALPGDAEMMLYGNNTPQDDLIKLMRPRLALENGGPREILNWFRIGQLPASLDLKRSVRLELRLALATPDGRCVLRFGNRRAVTLRMPLSTSHPFGGVTNVPLREVLELQSSPVTVTLAPGFLEGSRGSIDGAYLQFSFVDGKLDRTVTGCNLLGLVVRQAD